MHALIPKLAGIWMIDVITEILRKRILIVHLNLLQFNYALKLWSLKNGPRVAETVIERRRTF